LISHRAAILFFLAAFLPFVSRAQFPPPPGTGPGLPETIEAIDAARVTTRILYVTAHPDDERADVLTYLARGLHADVALLSITRGEGGQNALGPEQAPQLGLIRTQELLAATRGYGVKLYFTRAKDFGFSKTPEETEKIWGQPVLEDMVRVIREFRPNIVINNWGGVHGGHGHHQLSGIWTPKAVKLAADPKYLVVLKPRNVPAWDNNGQGVQVLDIDRSDPPKGYVLPLNEISPLYGKSWREIGLDAFVNHRTQGIAGFLNSPFLRRQIALLPEDGSKLDPASLSRSILTINSSIADKPCRSDQQSCPSLSDAEQQIEKARNAVLVLDWKSATESLARAAKDVAAILAATPDFGAPSPGPAYYDLIATKKRIDRALQLAAGIGFTAESERADVVTGDPLVVNVRSRCRPEISCKFGKVGFGSNWMSVSTSDEGGDTREERFTVVLHPRRPDVQWANPEFDLDLPEPLPLVSASREVEIAGYPLPCSATVSNTTATSTSVSRVPVRLVPAFTLAVEPQQTVEILGAANKSFEVFLRVHSYFTKAAKVSVGLETPDGFTASAPVEVSFDGIGDQYAKLTVTPPANLAPGNYTITAYAKRGDEKFSTTLEPLQTMPTILWNEPAQTVVHAFDINVPANLRVGYISAEGEMIPDALRRLGISVEMLDANALTFGDLSSYSAIVVGVRAYELRPELASANQRLLDYVSGGGTLIVQYNRDFIWNKFLPAPYHATIGNPTPRITDENAAVKFLKPDDRLLNWPNRITQDDFKNWVQERGLYFWSDFDAKYTPLLAMHDPGEQDLTGGLVYTPLGKGTYIYTGLAFFRELPEGVPGAYRLFVNLLSASRK
jgi:LmbE family N-acetylglucosaminyl deacetylase